MKQAEREGGVGAGYRREMPIARCRGASPDRIDRHERRSVLTRLKDRPPEMRIRRQDIGAPKYDKPGMSQRLRVHSNAIVTQRIARSASTGDRADRDYVTRCAEHIPKAASGAVDTLDEPHVAGAHERPNGLGTVFRSYVIEFRSDPVKRLFP